MSEITQERLENAYFTARNALLAECVEGHWTGELSSSAVSTATTVSAWVMLLRSGKLEDKALREACLEALPRAKDWLLRAQNADGGWGDTDRSYTNIAATMLATAALKLYAGFFADEPPEDADVRTALEKAENALQNMGGIKGVRKRYGKDKTFAVPILMNAALAGMVSWREVSPLPFEFACIPHRFLGMVRLPVVSYAIPALVAIGQAVFHHRGTWNPLAWAVRKACVGKSLRVLREKQPRSGGFLEAAPLTAFVLMSLASVPRENVIPEEREVLAAGARFLLDSLREDGSVPIDTNLATWLTNLAVQALSRDEETLAKVDAEWILSCQHREVHPFTHAAPGGWGWTDLSGAVPDADDTPCALLALHTLSCSVLLRRRDVGGYLEAAKMGVGWLLDIQNSDGGIPTFCRGWGALPFDRSGTDLTAHAMRAIHRWMPKLAEDADRMQRVISRGFRYLERTQRKDGTWVPLWFGDQDHPAEENPVYGTTRVLQAWWELGRDGEAAPQRAVKWLRDAQNEDGSWGKHVEETALATEVMLLYGEKACAEKGVQRLVEWVESGEFRHAAPIGFYFAKLWYYERLYPIIFTVKTLAEACEMRE